MNVWGGNFQPLFQSVLRVLIIHQAGLVHSWSVFRPGNWDGSGNAQVVLFPVVLRIF